jgi:hypothetical protein
MKILMMDKDNTVNDNTVDDVDKDKDGGYRSDETNFKVNDDTL